MTKISLSRFATYAQNGLGLAVFGGLFLTQAASWLLYVYPSQEWLWRLSVPLRRLTWQALDNTLASSSIGPLGAVAMLSALMLLPVISFARRSWLGTAASGHIALALCFLFTYNAMGRAYLSSQSASLGPVVVRGFQSTEVVTLVLLTVIALGLCVLNHVAFFRHAAPR